MKRTLLILSFLSIFIQGWCDKGVDFSGGIVVDHYVKPKISCVKTGDEYRVNIASSTYETYVMWNTSNQKRDADAEAIAIEMLNFRFTDGTKDSRIIRVAYKNDGFSSPTKFGYGLAIDKWLPTGTSSVDDLGPGGKKVEFDWTFKDFTETYSTKALVGKELECVSVSVACAIRARSRDNGTVHSRKRIFSDITSANVSDCGGFDGMPLYSYLDEDTYITMDREGGIQWVTTEENVVNNKLSVSCKSNNTYVGFANTPTNRESNRNLVVNGCAVDKINNFYYTWSGGNCNRSKRVDYYVLSCPKFGNSIQRYNDITFCKNVSIIGDTLVYVKPELLSLDSVFTSTTYTWQYYDEKLNEWLNVADLFNVSDVEEFYIDKNLYIDFSKSPFDYKKLTLRQVGNIGLFDQIVYSDPITIGFYDYVSESDLVWRDDISFEVCENGTLGRIDDFVTLSDSSKIFKNELLLSYYVGSSELALKSKLTDKVKFGDYDRILVEAHSGCNSVTKEKVLRLHDLLSFSEERVKLLEIGAYSDSEHKESDVTANFSIVSRKEKPLSSYTDNYNVDFEININRGKTFTISGLEMGDYMLNDVVYKNVDYIDVDVNGLSNFYIYQLNSLGCKGFTRIYVKVNAYGGITGNNPLLGKDTIYHCPNSKITTGEIDSWFDYAIYANNKDYKIEYQYRYRRLGDDNWQQVYTTNVPFEDFAIQIQRVANFGGANDKYSSSNIVTIYPIKKGFEIGLATSSKNKFEKSKLNLCFDNPLYASIFDSHIDLSDAVYWRIDDGKIVELRKPVDGVFKLTDGIGSGIKSVTLAVCEGTLFSSPVEVYSPDTFSLDIRSELSIYTDCRYAGEVIEIDKKNVSEKADYFFVQNSKNLSEVVLTSQTKYLTVVKINEGCSFQDTVHINVHNAIYPTKLRIGNETYGNGSEIEVCADMDLNVTSETASDRLLYSFKDITDNNEGDFSEPSNYFNRLKFVEKGKTYTMLRQAQVDKQCYGKIDTFIFKTYPEFKFDFITSSKAGKRPRSVMGSFNEFSSYCKGDGDTITFVSSSYTIEGGTGEYTYHVAPYLNIDSAMFSGVFDGKSFSVGFPEVKEESYYVRIYDKNCPSYCSKNLFTYKGGTSEATGFAFRDVVDINDFSNVKYTDGTGDSDIKNIKKLKGETDWELTIDDNIGKNWNYVVSVVGVDSEPKKPSCPTKRPETETTIKITPDNSDATLRLYRWAFLDDCQTQCVSSIEIPYHCSNRWGNIDKFGISLSTDDDEKQTMYVGCDGSAVEVSTDIEDLSKNKGGLYYDIYRFHEIEDEVSYQWQEKIGNSYWKNIEGATKSSAKIKVNSNEVKYVRCIITYNGDKITSNNAITIYSEQTVNSEPLYGINNTIFTEICAGASVEALDLELSKAYPISIANNKTNIKYVWEYSTDKKSWTELDDDESKPYHISEVNSYKTSFFADKVDKETYIRCGIKFNNCKTIVYSYLYTIKMDDSVNRYPLHDENGNSYVRMISSPIINGVSRSLDFIVDYQIDEDKSIYSWGAVTDERNKFIKVDSKNSVSVSQSDWDEDYFTAGLHQATIQKEHIEGCKSKLDTFTYELFDQMSIVNINDSILEYNLCKNDTIKNIMVIGYGGDYRDMKPQIQWYVKSGTYEGAIEKANLYLHYDSISITQKKTFTGNIWGLVAYQDLTLYATIHSGDYPIDITTPTIIVNVVSDVKPGRIETKGGSICNNSLPLIYEAAHATGGSGNYKYIWQRSFDEGETWEALTTDGEESYSGVASEALTANAVYKRTVIDNCGAVIDRKDSRIDKYITPYSHSEEYYSSSTTASVTVKPEFTTDADKVLLNSYNKTIVVPTNQEVQFQYNTEAGINTQYSYFVIRNAENEIIDTLVQNEVWDDFTDNFLAKDAAIHREGNYYYTLTRYNKEDHCPSVKDTIVVAVIDGGEIEFENLTKISTNEYWMCPSDSIGLIKSVYTSDKIISYKWSMCDANKNETYDLYDLKTSNPINTESVDVDNTNVANIIRKDDGKGEERVFKFVRDGFYEEKSKPVSSDTLFLHVAGNINKLKLTESITPKYSEICENENRVNIDVNIDSESIYDKKFGALKFFSNNGAGSSNGKTFRTYWEQAYGNGQDGISDDLWTTVDNSEGNKNRFNPTQTLEINGITSDEMSYRFVMDDGCNKNYTYASVTVLKDSVGTFLFEKYVDAEKHFVETDYIEIGDSIRVVYQHPTGSSPSVNWYDAEECDSCARVSDNKEDYRNHFTIGNVKGNEQLYMSLNIRGEIEGEICEGKRVRVPLTVYPYCTGGLIVANNDKTCNDGDFSIVNSYNPAQGGDGNFVYSWQYSLDLDNNSWSTIESAKSVYLEADMLNSVAKGNALLYVRRKATNRGGSSVYSNVVTLERYDEFKPGMLAFSDDVKRTAICYDDLDSIPTIATTLPTGGIGEEIGYTYLWAIAVNSLTFDTLINETGKSLDLTGYLNAYKIDSLNENAVQVKCIYNDVFNTCGSVESEPISFIIHPQVQTPSIHQGGGECDSELTIVCVDDTTNYYYRWSQYYDGGVFTGEVGNCIKLFRPGSGSADVLEYGVVGIHKKSGCQTKEFRFDHSTMPILRQQETMDIDTICNGSDYMINLPGATGGVGEKKYQWLQSDDDDTYTEVAGGNTPTLMLRSVSKNAYYKRVVSDACIEIITEAIKINVHDTVKPLSVVASNFQCRGSLFPISINDSSIQGRILRVYNLTTLGSLDGNLGSHEIELDEKNARGAVAGFDADVNTFAFVTFDRKLRCHSTIEQKKLVNKPHVKASYANISAEDYSPCNETFLTIPGEDAVETSIKGYTLEPDKEDVGFLYKWYVSNDGHDFGFVPNEHNKDLSLEIIDTLYVTRVVDNTCGETANSDTLKFVGKKLTDFIPQLDVVTSYVKNPDGEVTIKSSTFADCVLSGDGGVDTINTMGIKYGITLPYSAKRYQDSMLYVRYTRGQCYRPFRIKPLVGNQIDTDCRDKSIIASNIEGLSEDAILVSSVWSIQQTNLGEWCEINASNGYQIDELGNLEISEEDKGRSFKKDVCYRTYEDVTYSIKSNVLYATLSAPILSKIAIDSSSTYVKRLSENRIQKFKTQDLVFVDTVVGNCTDIHLEIEFDDNQTDIVNVYPSDGVVKFSALNDVNARYSLVATNRCGTTKSETFIVENLEMEYIDDSNVRIDHPKCKGDNAYVKCYDNAYRGTGKYTYTYEINPHAGASYTGVTLINRNLDDENPLDKAVPYNGGETTDEICINGVEGNIDVRISRYDSKIGMIAIKEITLYQDSVKSDFLLSLDNRDIVYSYSELETIELDEGERISLISTSTNATKYLWNVHWHNNPFVLNAAGQYDLKTDNENPSMYVYSDGYYDISLVASNENCKDTLRFDNALFVSKGSGDLRSSTSPVMWLEDDLEYPISDASESGELRIYPSFIIDKVFVSTTDKKVHSVVLIDVSGKHLHTSTFSGFLQISMNDYISGVYYIVVDDRLTYKVIKK